MNLFRQGRLAEAETELRQALELHPAMPEYRLNLINVCSRKGKWRRPRSSASIGISSWETSVFVYRYRSSWPLCSPDVALRNPEPAAHHARRATELSPKLAVGWRAWAGRTIAWASFTRQSRLSRNRVHCRKAGRAIPGNGSCWHSHTGSSRCGLEMKTGDARATRSRISPLLRASQQGNRPVVAPDRAISWISESGISARKQRRCCGSWRSGNSKQSTRSQRQSHCACELKSIVFLQDLGRKRPVVF